MPELCQKCGSPMKLNPEWRDGSPIFQVCASDPKDCRIKALESQLAQAQDEVVILREALQTPHDHCPECSYPHGQVQPDEVLDALNHTAATAQARVAEIRRQALEGAVESVMDKCPRMPNLPGCIIAGESEICAVILGEKGGE